MNEEVYVYWRIGATPLAHALQATAAFQAELRQRFPALRARLLHRAEGTDKATVMEIYSHPGGVSEALAQQIECTAETSLATLPAVPQRHREVFLPFDEANRG